MKLDKLDKVFSEFIRLRDANSVGIVHCISCGKMVSWKEADAGHYVNRKHMSLRYNEINVNAQCRSCNRFDEGNIPAYTLALVKKYGDDIISKLLVAKHKNVKFSQFDVDYWVNHYKKMVEIRKKHLKL